MHDHINKKEAGSAMIKLKEIADARSYNPMVLSWVYKNLITWYKLTLSNPGI